MRRNGLFIAFLLCTIIGNAQGLSKKESESTADRLYAEWLTGVRSQYAKLQNPGKIHAMGSDMWIWSHTFGEKPADGRSLFISLHGGGECPKEINDEQWGNQCNLYRPAEGVYLCPRAPYNTWDMWHKESMDSLLRQTIDYCVACKDVNPDKVYIMGYSAGGDGTWRLATRMSDYWAAASAMAGHPGGVALQNVRNMPFTNWCGSEDAAYDRNYHNRECGIELDSLYRDDPKGYIYETHILEGLPHWMNQQDTIAVPWMAQFKRNPYPDKIIWYQCNVQRRTFYWITLPEGDYEEYSQLRIHHEGNVFTITHSDYDTFTIWLNDDMVDLSKPVIVRCNGKTLFKGKLSRTEQNLRESLAERHDRRYMFAAKVVVRNAESN